MNVQQFNTSFNFQLTKPHRRRFHLYYPGSRPNGPWTHGEVSATAELPDSVAVKFDLYNNAGEGPDSTGLYTNGAIPNVPAIDLTPTGINLHSGHIFNAQLAYNGSTLTVVITDTVTKATATQTYSVNIPAIVGGPTAYVGFTGGSGGFGATQEILNWSFSSMAVN